MMKNILIITAITIISFSCKKKETDNINTNIQGHRKTSLFYGLSLPPNANAELRRFASDIADIDFAIAIIDNAMSVAYSSNRGNHIMISGATNPADNISIVLNGTNYSARPDGQWLTSNINFTNYIGTDVDVEIRSNNKTLKSTRIYVPKAALSAPLSPAGGGAFGISRSGNNLIWTPDNSNKMGYVVLRYEVVDTLSETIAFKSVLLENNGHFNLDALISDSAARVLNFDLIALNTVTAMTPNSKKILFYIGTWDHNVYEIAK